MTLRRVPWLCALLLGVGVFISASRAHAIPESEIRTLVGRAVDLEKQSKWEEARQIYELLLSQVDPGLNIRSRHQHALRRCWQVRRHQDTSYRNQVLSVEYGQALKLNKIVSRTLLEGSVDKKKVDPTMLFHKGLDELHYALANPDFVRDHIPAAKHGDIPIFRALLKRKYGDLSKLSRDEAVKQIGQIALAAEEFLDLNPTTAVMEFACGACYAIDDYTVYLTPNQLQQLAHNLAQSEAIGVGLILTIRDNKIVVNQLTMNSPAYRSDISLGDQIISVDKKAVVDLSLLTVKELLEGPIGSMVEVEVLSQGDASTRLIRMTRERAAVPSVVAFIWPGTSHGYLKINTFTKTTVQDLNKALIHLSNEGMKGGVIIDLRDNNGGVFESAIDTARRFLSTGIITSTVHQDANKNQTFLAKDPKALTLPLVVLVDGDTASAAEVLAGALKDNNRAYLIGQRTYGKGCTQCVLELPKANTGAPTGGMRLTVARFFSPKGVPYSGRGVVPHFIIEDPMVQSQSNMMGGPYIARAIDELNRLTMPK